MVHGSQFTVHGYPIGRLLCGLLIALILAVTPLKGFGADRGKDYTVRAPTYRMLIRIQKLMEEERYQEALDKIEHFAPRVKRVPFERVLLYQTKAYALMSQTRYKEAISALEIALEGDYLPDDTARNLRYNLAQLYIHDERLADGITVLREWFAETPEPPAEAHALAGHAHYLLARYAEAEAHLKQAIAKAKHPQEPWYQLLLASYYEQNKFPAAEKLLRATARKFPEKRTYWIQLSNIQLHLEQDKRALASLELAEDGALLNGDDLIRLVRLNLHLNAPHRAARLLKEAIDSGRIPTTAEHLEMLADAWVLAREYESALAALDQAESLDTEQQARLQLRKGELLIQLERWEDAVQVLRSAGQADETRTAARAQLLLGISAYYHGEYPLSLAALRRAVNYEDTRDQAEGWLNQTEQRMEESTP